MSELPAPQTCQCDKAAAETLALLAEISAQAPECDEYPAEGVVSCGWRSLVSRFRATLSQAGF